uniref:Predicted protein n=1 Tax=Physcomitrium patens TaxID=3218 RepID=A9U546_PHYPA
MGLLPSMRLDLVGQPNEVPNTEALVPFQAIPFSMPFWEKRPFHGKIFLEIGIPRKHRRLFQFEIQGGRKGDHTELKKEKNNGTQESSVHRVEVVQAVHTRSQQMGKGPIQHLDDPEAKGQLDPIVGQSNLGPDMGSLLIIRPKSVVHSNEVPITEASIPCQAVPFST